MKYLIAALVFISMSKALAENTTILSCAVKNSEGANEIKLDSLGKVLMTFKKSGQSIEYKCRLRLDFFTDGRKAMRSQILMDVSRGDCAPSVSPKLEKEVLRRISVMVDMENPDKPQGRMSWLSAHPSSLCQIKELRLSEIEAFSKKWMQRRIEKSKEK